MLLERLKTSGVDKLLGDFDGVIVGRSAGALVLCKKIVVTYRPSLAVKVIDGLGLVDLTLKAHYKLGCDEALKAFSCEMDVYAVPKGSALVCENGCLSI